MPNDAEDAGILLALIERFNNQRLPRALDMKNKVDRGEDLESFDVDYLEEMLDDIRAINPLLERHPEYQPLIVKTMGLYTEIAEKAAANAEKP